MITEFEPVAKGILTLLEAWEPKLKGLPVTITEKRRNSQNRTIKQIVGHMVDSASNNTHRVIHLQYQKSPFEFPNYATNGNNDRWIAIQNYQQEDWETLVHLWKYSNLHFVHVVGNIDPACLEKEWVAAPGEKVSLRAMMTDYLRHFELHIGEIEELINEG